MNYMDLFESPEEYLLHQAVRKRNRDILPMKTLKDLAAQENIPFSEKSSKENLIKALLDKHSIAWLEDKCKHFGVPSYCFQQKFGISHAAVKCMAAKGFLRITGYEDYPVDARWNTADLYNVEQYFQLTRDEVYLWLTENTDEMQERTAI